MSSKVLDFCLAKASNLIEIHRRIRIPYIDRCMSCTQMYEWSDKFKNGVTSVEESSLPGPAVTEDITALENVIRENRRVSQGGGITIEH